MSVMRDGVMRSDWATPDLSRAIFPRRRGTVGTRIVLKTGGYSFDNTVQKTYRIFIEVAADNFSAVQPIFCNMSETTPYTVGACNARAAANFTDAVGTPIPVTVPGGGVIAAAPLVGRGRYVLGDWVDLASLPRNDSYSTKGAIVVFDAYVSTSGTIVSNGGSSALTYHNSRAGRKVKALYNDGNCVATPANFVSTTSRGHCPIVGVRYRSNSRIVNVMISGDSISNGTSEVSGIAFALPAAEMASAVSKNKVFETMFCGLGGANPTTFSLFIDDMISYGLTPDVLVQPIGSPNGLGDSGILDSNITTCKTTLGYTLGVCASNGIAPICWTILPTENPPKNWGATDSKRRNYNIESLSYTGPRVIDFAGTVSGSIDAQGQMLPLPGITFDGVHLNATGCSLISPVLANALLDVV